MRADEAFRRCDPKYLEYVDNYAYLCLGEAGRFDARVEHDMMYTYLDYPVILFNEHQDTYLDSPATSSMRQSTCMLSYSNHFFMSISIPTCLPSQDVCCDAVPVYRGMPVSTE